MPCCHVGRRATVLAQVVTLYLDGFFDPPLPNAERFYILKPIPNSGKDEYEILAIVEPPIVYDGGQVTTVRIRGYDDRLRDRAGNLLIGDTQILTVWVRSAEGDPELGVDFSAVATHLPELWRRGGYWQWFVDSMNAFVAREGHSDVPPDHVEDGFDDVGQYIDKLR